MFFKEIGEIGYVVKAKVKCDLFHRLIRVRQQALRLDQYPFLDHLGGCFMIVNGKQVG